MFPASCCGPDELQINPVLLTQTHVCSLCRLTDLLLSILRTYMLIHGNTINILEDVCDGKMATRRRRRDVKWIEGGPGRLVVEAVVAHL